MVVTKSGFRSTQQKLQDIKQGVLRAGKATVKDLAEMGKAKARHIAPYYSGKTARLIKVFSGIDKDGPYASVVAQNSTASD